MLLVWTSRSGHCTENEREQEISYYHCRRYVFLQIVAFDMLSRCNFYFGSLAKL